MPPKKGGKGKGKKSEGYVLDGVATVNMNREQLEVFALRLHEELERQREERNFFMLERDKLRTFWELTRNQLDECRAIVRNKDREMDEMITRHHEDLKLQRQRVKHLLYENQTNAAESKAENMVALRTAQDHFFTQELRLLEDKVALKNKIQELQLGHLTEVRSRKLEQSEELKKLRETFETKFREMEAKYEKDRNDLRDQLEFKHRVEMKEVEERKNNHINTLMQNHDKIFAETKIYYNDITLANLSLINGLKEQLCVLKKNEDDLVKTIAKLEEENRNLVNPLNQAKAEVAEMNRRMKNYKKDQTSLTNTKLLLSNATKELDNLRWENEVLENRFHQVQTERNELQDKFKQALVDVQTKIGLKTVQLEEKIVLLSENLDIRDAEISHLIRQSKIDPQASEKALSQLENLIKNKNEMIDDLRYQLTKVCKAHDDLLNTYECKLQQYGIHKDDLGFKPLRNIPYKMKHKDGPAGLVTVNR